MKHYLPKDIALRKELVDFLLDLRYQPPGHHTSYLLGALTGWGQHASTDHVKRIRSALRDGRRA